MKPIGAYQIFRINFFVTSTLLTVAEKEKFPPSAKNRPDNLAAREFIK